MRLRQITIPGFIRTVRAGRLHRYWRGAAGGGV